jgi:hypothetical protein
MREGALSLPEILLLLGYGVAFWLIGTLLYRARGAMVFEATRVRFWMNWILTPLLSTAACSLLLERHHVPAARWAAAALLIALPGMFGEALVLSRFSRFMPRLRSETGSRYAAFLFATYGLVLAVCEMVTLRAR